MEGILEACTRPYDASAPVVVMDEKPYQLLDHARPSIEAKPGRTRKEHYEYSRKGVCSIFVMGRTAARQASGQRPAPAHPRGLGP